MSVFSVQRYLEDHFNRRGLVDLDQYAIRAANAFDRMGAAASVEAIVRHFSSIRTTFFRRNTSLDRRQFETQLAEALRMRFKKKGDEPRLKFFIRGLKANRARLGARRRSIRALLQEFQRAVQGRGIDVFWLSRKQHRLRSRPETLAQGMLAVFAKGVVGNDGAVLREIFSGIGFIDIGISFGGQFHLIELKILTSKFTGPSQLAAYMQTEGRNKGWLVLIDARKPDKKVSVPSTIKVSTGVIRTIVIEVNPTPPHTHP